MLDRFHTTAERVLLFCQPELREIGDVFVNLVMLQSIVLAAASNALDVLSAPEAYIDPNTGGMLFQVLAIVFTFLSGFILFGTDSYDACPILSARAWSAWA